MYLSHLVCIWRPAEVLTILRLAAMIVCMAGTMFALEVLGEIPGLEDVALTQYHVYCIYIYIEDVVYIYDVCWVPVRGVHFVPWGFCVIVKLCHCQMTCFVRCCPWSAPLLKAQSLSSVTVTRSCHCRHGGWAGEVILNFSQEVDGVVPGVLEEGGLFLLSLSVRTWGGC